MTKLLNIFLKKKHSNVTRKYKKQCYLKISSLTIQVYASTYILNKQHFNLPSRRK